MCKILLSINPEHVENILSEKKTYEYRKVKCKEKIDKILIYSTFPVMRVVGEVDVEDVLIDTPKKIWDITHDKSGISKEYFYNYYENKGRAVAFKLGKVNKYKVPVTLAELGINSAPQSFLYLC